MAKRLDDHDAAARRELVLGVLGDADGVAHVMQGVEETDEVDLSVEVGCLGDVEVDAVAHPGDVGEAPNIARAPSRRYRRTARLDGVSARRAAG